MFSRALGEARQPDAAASPPPSRALALDTRVQYAGSTLVAEAARLRDAASCLGRFA